MRRSYSPSAGGLTMPLAVAAGRRLMSMTSTTGALRHRVDELGPWFHNLRLDGIQTAPEHFLGDIRLEVADSPLRLPQDLSGWHVLDIGCNGGFYPWR